MDTQYKDTQHDIHTQLLILLPSHMRTGVQHSPLATNLVCAIAPTITGILVHSPIFTPLSSSITTSNISILQSTSHNSSTVFVPSTQTTTTVVQQSIIKEKRNRGQIHPAGGSVVFMPPISTIVSQGEFLNKQCITRKSSCSIASSSHQERLIGLAGTIGWIGLQKLALITRCERSHLHFTPTERTLSRYRSHVFSYTLLTLNTMSESKEKPLPIIFQESGSFYLTAIST